MPNALTPRRRGVVIFYSILGVGVAVLIGLPAIGLARINHETDRSHDFTRLTGSVEHLTTGLLQLVTGSLARYGNTGAPAYRTSAVEGIAQARATIVDIESQKDEAERLGLDTSVEAQLALARAVLEPAETFIAEVDAGATTQNAASRPAVVGAAGQILQSRSTFTSETDAVAEKIDRSRRGAVREAAYLLLAGVVFALVVIFALGFLNRARTHRIFAAEESRREAAERLAAHRADVVSMASHELRNPLTALTMASELLAREAARCQLPELGALAEDAHVAAWRCNALVNELLDLGRLDADRLHLKTGTTPLRQPLAEAFAMAQAHHGPRDVRLEGAVESSVLADPDRLRVILRNLIDNAFKYSEPDSVVSVSIAGQGDRVLLDVRDEGVGVPPEFHDRIFQRFERLSAPGHVGGVGIGLFLSRELARRMNGDLRCREVERGADFELELPVSA